MREEQPLTPEEIADTKRILKNGRELAEFYDTVQIICTRVRSDGKTLAACWTHGNAFAVEGAAHAWLEGAIPSMDSGQES